MPGCVPDVSYYVTYFNSKSRVSPEHVHIEPKHVASSWGDPPRIFLPICKVTKLPFRASDNATVQTVLTLQNPIIHNAQKCSCLILKIALFENLKYRSHFAK